jgi:hypothetical protein
MIVSGRQAAGTNSLVLLLENWSQSFECMFLSHFTVMLHQEQNGPEDAACRRPSVDSSQPETFPRQLDFKLCHVLIVFLDV